jgi:DnaJ-class molecular chaperone
MSNKRNLYRVLHVQPDAPVEIIRSSFRTLMQTLKSHPDLGGDPVKARLIIHAYEVLTNPQTRMEYDKKLINDRHPMMRYWVRLLGSDSRPTDKKSWTSFVPPVFD